LEQWRRAGRWPASFDVLWQRLIDGDVPVHVANGQALLINDYAASPVQARAPSLVAVDECAA
jgi:hypothetical protein